MGLRLKIGASTPYYNEEKLDLFFCQKSAECLDDHLCFPGGIVGLVPDEKALWESQGEMRDWGRKRLLDRGMDWIIQLDADERLMHGELLYDILPRWDSYFPIPYISVFRDVMTFAPSKVIRSTCVIRSHSEFIALSGDGATFDHSGYNAWDFSLPSSLPHILHLDAKRDPATRLSAHELDFEARPEGCSMIPHFHPYSLREKP